LEGLTNFFGVVETLLGGVNEGVLLGDWPGVFPGEDLFLFVVDSFLICVLSAVLKLSVLFVSPLPEEAMSVSLSTT